MVAVRSLCSQKNKKIRKVHFRVSLVFEETVVIKSSASLSERSFGLALSAFQGSQYETKIGVQVEVGFVK